MTSKTRAKGWRTVRKGRKLLEEAGYLTDTVEKTSKFAKQKDLFGLFDIIAICPEQLAMIQFTTNKNHPHQKYVNFAKKYGNEKVWIEQWVWEDFKGFYVWSYYPSGIKEKRKVI